MVNYQIDLQHIQRTLNQPVIKGWIDIWRQLQDTAKFGIGDVVIETYRRDDGAVAYVENPLGSGEPVRLVIVYRDSETGFTFASRIKTNGELGRPQCLEIQPHRRYILDPEYVDSILLNKEYDPFKEQEVNRHRVAAVRKHNAKLKFTFSSAAEMGDFFLKHLATPGTTFWLCYRSARVEAERPAETIAVRSSLGGNKGGAEAVLTPRDAVTLVYRRHDGEVKVLSAALHWPLFKIYLTKPMSYRQHSK